LLPRPRPRTQTSRPRQRLEDNNIGPSTLVIKWNLSCSTLSTVNNDFAAH